MSSASWCTARCRRWIWVLAELPVVARPLVVCCRSRIAHRRCRCGQLLTVHPADAIVLSPNPRVFVIPRPGLSADPGRPDHLRRPVCPRSTADRTGHAHSHEPALSPRSTAPARTPTDSASPHWCTPSRPAVEHVRNSGSTTSHVTRARPPDSRRAAQLGAHNAWSPHERAKRIKFHLCTVWAREPRSVR